jgi:very-short-patch-repair endonuclease
MLGEPMSFLEGVLAQDLMDHGIAYEREFKFSPDRKYRADFRIPNSPILIEVEGGAGFGRHSRRKGFIEDSQKYALAAREGWIVLRFTKPQIEERMVLPDGTQMDSEAVETIRCAIKYWGIDGND